MPSLSLVEGWHAPAGRRTWQPRPLAQARQIRPAAPVGARKPGARPADRLAGQPERRQPNRRSGRDPGPDPTPTPPQNHGSRAGSTIHSLPAESARVTMAPFGRAVSRISSRYAPWVAAVLRLSRVAGGGDRSAQPAPSQRGDRGGEQRGGGGDHKCRSRAGRVRGQAAGGGPGGEADP